MRENAFFLSLSRKRVVQLNIAIGNIFIWPNQTIEFKSINQNHE
jgi:hypothetical protein